MLRRPNGSLHEVTTTVRADPLEDFVDAALAKGAFKTADTRVGVVRRQIAVAVLTVGAKLEHAGSVAGAHPAPSCKLPAPTRERSRVQSR